MMTNIPKFLALSGLDGAGKSTQIQHLVDFYRQMGEIPVIIWARGGYTPLFNALKAGLRRLSGQRLIPPSGRSAARTQAMGSGWKRRLWLSLAIFDLILVYGVQVRWLLWTGRTVICDRYLGDTAIDFALNFSSEAVGEWWMWRFLAWVTPRPAAAFLLLIPVEESQRRSQLKDEPFPDSPEVLAQRLAAYRSRPEFEGWLEIDCRASIEAVRRKIMAGIGVAYEN